MARGPGLEVPHRVAATAPTSCHPWRWIDLRIFLGTVQSWATFPCLKGLLSA
jgi:hypothetical protein